MQAVDPVLAVETSSRLLSVAAQAPDGSVFETSLNGTPRHAEQLMDLVAHGLKALRLKKDDLRTLLWGSGPGSFTGLRIGFAALKGFYLGLGGRHRVFGASSLDLIAYGVGIHSGDLLVSVDARRDRIYAAVYRFHGGSIEKLLQDSLLSFDQLMKWIKPDTTLAGDAWLRYGNEIRKRCRSVHVLDEAFWYPRAASLIRLYRCRIGWLDALSLKTMTPRYFR